MRWMNPMNIRHTPYAEGVRFQSPGVAAQRRTLGSGPRWLPYAEGVSQNGGMTTGRAWPFVKPLRGICQNTHRLPRVRCCAATLGCGVQPLRGKEIDRQRKSAHPRNKCRNHDQSSLSRPSPPHFHGPEPFGPFLGELVLDFHINASSLARAFGSTISGIGGDLLTIRSEISPRSTMVFVLW